MNDYKKALLNAGQPQLIEKFEEMGVKSALEIIKMIQNNSNLLQEMGIDDVIVRGKIEHELDKEWGKMMGLFFKPLIVLMIIFMILFLYVFVFKNW